MSVEAEGLTVVSRLAQAVITRTHAGQLKAILREQLGESRGKKQPAAYYLQVLNRAERELLAIAPVLQLEDREGRTSAEGFSFDLSQYRAAFIRLILRRKQRIYRPLAPRAIPAEEVRNVNVEVAVENLASVSQVFGDLRDPYKRIERLNVLEPQVLGCIDAGLVGLSADIEFVQREIGDLNRQLTALNREMQKKSSFFSRRSDPREMALKRGQRQHLARELKNYHISKEALEMRRRVMSEQKGIKRLCTLAFIAKSKLRALGIAPSLTGAVA